jgi:hypothetical protein
MAVFEIITVKDDTDDTVIYVDDVAVVVLEIYAEAESDS